MKTQQQAMRDIVLEALFEQMASDRQLFLLSGDFGAPALDQLRIRYPDRFVNVGIAEQNLVNVAAGLALEGYRVVAYAIAPFLTLRAFEQIRINLCLMADYRPMTVVLVGVGAGFSYSLAGPTHQCFEDLTVMRSLNNLSLYCPSDGLTARELCVHCLKDSGISYLRLDASPLPDLSTTGIADIALGYRELRSGDSAVMISTGYMCHVALRLADRAAAVGKHCGVIDVYGLSRFDAQALAEVLSSYTTVITLEEGFAQRGGLDALILGLVNDYRLSCRVISHGIPASYQFGQGSREQLLAAAGLSEAHLWHTMTDLLNR